MKTWPVTVTCSTTYEIKANNPEEAREKAIDKFLGDMVADMDIDTEVTAALEGEGCGEQCPVPGMSPEDCPYCMPNGFCQLENPDLECDDYYAYTGDEEKE